MWLIALVLTVLLWLMMDNILIAAILAIFAVYSYALVRALYWVKKDEGQNITPAQHEEEFSATTHSAITQVETYAIKNNDLSLEEENEVLTEDVDTSYIDFMEDNYKK